VARAISDISAFSACASGSEASTHVTEVVTSGAQFSRTRRTQTEPIEWASDLGVVECSQPDSLDGCQGAHNPKVVGPNSTPATN